MPPPANPPVLPPPLPARETNPWANAPAVAPPSAQPGERRCSGFQVSRGVLTLTSCRLPPTGAHWSSAAPVIVVPPPSSPAVPSHRRTPSEADRWLEEVSKSVKAPQHNPALAAAPPPAQPFPPHGQLPVSSVPSAPGVAFVPSLPASVPMLPPRQPAFHAPAPAPPPMANGLAFPQPSVPVVGITPSQMVANVFGSVTQALPFPVPASSTPPHEAPAASSIGPFVKPPPSSAPPQASNGGVAFNGADSWAAHTQLAPPSPAPQPPPAPQDDVFEAQWAALEGRSRQRTSPSPTNPFSSELHKTFEIQL